MGAAFHEVFSVSMVDNSLALPKVLSRPMAGHHVSPVFPKKISRKASHLWGQLKEYSELRMKFISLWVRRGLGIVQPRALNPALLEHGLTLVLPGIESESVFT